MNAYLKDYVKNQNNGSSVTDDPHNIIHVLLKELIKNVKIISVIEQKNSEKYTHAISRSLTIIFALQDSLDFEKGKKIAENLFTVYEFSRQAILHSAEEGQKLLTAIHLLEEIESAWAQIAEVAPAA
ncbi:MAG: flagellar protein FliS [Rhodospirillaceae bacterium]|jgi:flagellar protein FliS